MTHSMQGKLSIVERAIKHASVSTYKNDSNILYS